MTITAYKNTLAFIKKELTNTKFFCLLIQKKEKKSSTLKMQKLNSFTRLKILRLMRDAVVLTGQLTC